jgi:hypothetical protein
MSDCHNTVSPSIATEPPLITHVPSQHAFIVSGVNTLYLTHMTMMGMEEHAYQFIIRVSIPPAAQALLAADAHSNPNSTYWLGNASYDLMTLPELASGARREFLGVLYRDIPERKVFHCWPWNEEVPLSRAIPVTIERVILYRHFDFNLNQPINLSYFMFGSGSEAHITNFQVKEPAFDHVASLVSAPEWLSPRILEAGAPIEIVRRPGMAVYCRPPFRTGEVRVRYAGQGPERRIFVKRHLWFGTHVVNSKDPCAVENGFQPQADTYWDENL